MVAVNLKQSGAQKAGPSAEVTFQPRPMVYVVRFCGAQASSIRAAVGQAIAVLDAFLNRLSMGPPAQLVVVYRNHIEGAVTVQIGYPVSEEAAAAVSGEILAGVTPSGPMVELVGEQTLEQILAVGRSLPESSASYTWQILDEADFRPWTGKLVETLLVPAQFRPQLQRHAAASGGDH